DQPAALLLVPELLREGQRRLRGRHRHRAHGDHRGSDVAVPPGAEQGIMTAIATRAPRRRRDPVRHIVLVTLVVLAVITLVPLVLVALNAVKSPSDYAQRGPLRLPETLYFKGITDFWVRVDFGEKLFNSTVISGSVAVLA